MSYQTHSPRTLSSEDRLLLLGTWVELTEAHKLLVAEHASQITDWNHFVKYALRMHLSPLLHHTLTQVPQADVPKWVIGTLEKSRQGVLASNVLFHAHLEEVIRTLNEAKIDLIPLKGMFLAEAVYGDISLRHISDLDILVRSKDVETVVPLLVNKGWTASRMVERSAFVSDELGSQHPYKLTKGDATIELHVHVVGKASPMRVNISDYWQRSKPMEFCGGTIQRLAPFDLVQHLCIHLYRHLTGSHVKVSSFCDIRETILKYRDEIDWKLFLETSTSYNCLVEVQGILYICREYWGSDIPDRVFSGVEESAFAPLMERFHLHFSGNEIDMLNKLNSTLDRNLGDLRQLDSFGKKLRFLFDFVFPDRNFMEYRYGLKGWKVIGSYVYRPLSLIFKLTRVLLKR